MEGVEIAEMALYEAVSASLPRPKYCLLSESEAREYDCVETARRLSAEDEDTRLQASWHHYLTHIEAYVRWARNRKRFDVTYRHQELRHESTEDIVREALCSFVERVKSGDYNARQSRPCAYVKRIITNKSQDRLRKGIHPTREECEVCYREKGRCKFSGQNPPSERERKKCFLPPRIADLEEVSIGLGIAGLQGQGEWPPRQSDPSQDVQHLIEEKLTFEHVRDRALALMPSRLRPVEIQVLQAFCFEDKSGREIARQTNLTLDNVYQIHHRALKKLYRALILEDEDLRYYAPPTGVGTQVVQGHPRRGQ